MAESTATDATRTVEFHELEARVDAALAWLRPRLIALLSELFQSGLTPTRFFAWERQLRDVVREFGRLVLEGVLNAWEGDGGRLPHDLMSFAQGYRRLQRKTRNAHVATLFGTVTLWRFGYRFWDPAVQEPCLFPLELSLGLQAGVTPALADVVGRRLAEAGATQSRVIEFLREEHGVALGIKRLRQLTALLSTGLAEQRLKIQVRELLEALRLASESRGGRKPVIAVGRDGITLCEYRHRVHQVATAATVTVFNRSGKRVRTLYLAWRPELGQATMSRLLTDLLTGVLAEWEGALPTLAYVADSGGNESNYYEAVLRRMRHPRTGERLRWERVVDFYHASERVWRMAEMLFGAASPRYHAWTRRMLSLLKRKPRGAKRVLHSAATWAARTRMSASRRKKFRTAYNYIRHRTGWMRYCEYKRRHIPLGSGITEAACKTVYTQRLKLSGMRWSGSGAQQILTLRTTLLSHNWSATYAAVLEAHTERLPIPYAPRPSENCDIAA